MDSPVNVIPGDIFKYRKGLIIIPRSTAGTVNDSFMRGLSTLRFPYEPEETALGDLRLFPDFKTGLHIAFATSVDNYTSNYGAIAAIGLKVERLLRENNFEAIYCPMLGTGAGGLEPELAYAYLVLPLMRAERMYNFNVVVFEPEIFNELSEVKNLNAFQLARLCLKGAYDLIKRDASIRGILEDYNFYYQQALDAYNSMLSFQLDEPAKQNLLNVYLKFSKEKNFQAFIDEQIDKRFKEYLVKIGELIAHLDSKGYNKREWNKTPDKRTLAHANVRQNLWVQHLMQYAITKDLNALPNNIRNAIVYLLSPQTEIPALSKDDRHNIQKTFLGIDFPEELFGSNMIKYFNTIVDIGPVNNWNWGALAAKVLYFPRVRSLWTDKIATEPEESELEEKSPAADKENAPKVDSKAKTYQAKLHDDLYAKEDLLDYQLYAETIAKFIQSKDSHPPLSIGIFAPWGMGKTSLMKFIQAKLDKNLVEKNDATVQAKMIKGLWQQIVADVKVWSQRVATKIKNGCNTLLQILSLPVIFKTQDASPLSTEPRLSVKQVIKEINRRPFEKNAPGKYSNPTVWFNAWKYENSEQVLSGLSYEIINQLVDKLPNRFEKERFYFNLHRSRLNERKLLFDLRVRIYRLAFNLASKVLLFIAVPLAVVLFFKLGGINAALLGGGSCIALSMINAGFRYIKELKVDAGQYLNEYITTPEYDKKLGYFHEVESDLKNVFELMVNKSNPCVIFIDDLDRCSSKTVVDVIEAINLFINGDFPDCYFVIGMDAQMVASSIESQYKDLNERSKTIQKAHGSLGWYYMEKFVQLQFNLPNLSPASGQMLLKKLLESTSDHQLAAPIDISDLEKKVESVVLTDKTSVNEFTSKLNDAQAQHPEKVQEIKSQLIDRAAQELEDSDDDPYALLQNYSQYLSISPRVIKRFANLFRFYRFMQYVNVTSKLNELQEEEIAMMVIICIRWPRLCRLVQLSREFGETTLDRAKYVDTKFESDWSKESLDETMKWLQDKSLCEFVKTNKIKMERYVELGVW